MEREDSSGPGATRTVDRLLSRANLWLAENSRGGSDKEAWEAAEATLERANLGEVAEALEEILEAATQGDRDARNIVASFGRLHPPQSLANPVRKRELIGLYLVLREGGLWDTSTDLGNPLWREELERMLD